MKIKLLPIALSAVFLLGGCTYPEHQGNTPSNTENSNSQTDTDFSKTAEDMFSKRDLETSYGSDSIAIQLNGSSAECTSDKVKIDGSTITITDEGTYVISGTLEDGMLIVDADDKDKPHLVLNNVNITSAQSAPLYIKEADKVFVTLADGSSNTLTNGGTFTSIDDNNIDGVVFSKQDLTFNGNGELTVVAPIEHGIVCKDDLVFTGGTYTITSASHGMDVNDSVRINSGIFTINAGKDGIHVDNSDNAEKGFFYVNGGTFHITAEGDGVDAGYYIQIEDGNFTMLCGGGYENGSQSSSDNWGNMGGGNMGGGNRPGGRPGGRSAQDAQTTESDASTSMKGIKANNSILVNGGTFDINSADDCIHSNCSIFVHGGTYAIASGDDGIHADDTLVITNGTIDITQSYEGLEALHIQICGGDIRLQANDDGINAAGGTDSSGNGGRDEMFGGGRPGNSSNSNGTIVISGGNIFMYAKGDGIDANGSVEISGGTTIITGPIQGDTSILDFDTTGTITGGTFIGVGSSNMFQSFTTNTQGLLSLSASGSGTTQITLADADGTVLIDYTVETAFQCIMLSSPDLKTGNTYTITIGTQSGEFTAK